MELLMTTTVPGQLPTCQREAASLRSLIIIYRIVNYVLNPFDQAEVRRSLNSKGRLDW